MHLINVDIIYALPEKAWKQSLKISRGSTPLDVIEKSDLLSEFPSLNEVSFNYGVYSKRVDENYLMAEGDRLEIYRELTIDPKTARREFAKAGKTMANFRD